MTKHTVSESFRSGLMIALGGAVMDIIYVLIAAFASSAIVVTLVDLITGNGWIPLGFQVLCIFILLVMGIRYMRHKHHPGSETKIMKVEEAQEQRAQRLGYSSPFFIGVLIAIANLASPTFLPSMISVVSYIKANGLLTNSVQDNVLYAVGFGVGTSCWFGLAAKVLARHREKFSAGVLSTIYKFAGGTFIFCAFLLTYHVVMSTDWTMLR